MSVALRGLPASWTVVRSAYRGLHSTWARRTGLRCLGALSTQRKSTRKVPHGLTGALAPILGSVGCGPRGLTTLTTNVTDKFDLDPFQTPQDGRFPHHNVYSALDVQEKQIRLVSLAPGTGDDPILCALFTTPLANPPAYEALTYCAGDPQEYLQVHLNGHPFNIFRPLHAALHQLRQQSGTRLLWIDQICVNQSDIPERNAQVSIVRNIYKQADRTIVWLGTAGPHNRAAFDFLDKFCAFHSQGIHQVVRSYMREQEVGTGQPPHAGGFVERYDEDSIPGWLMQMTDILVSQDWLHPRMAQAMDWLFAESNDVSQTDTWNALNDLVSRSWWSRCWGVTEFVSFSSTIFQSGERSIDWKTLDLFTAAVILTRIRKGPLENNAVLDDFIVSAEDQYRLCTTRRHQWEGERMLLHYLNSTSGCSASDARDNVYAVLELVPNEQRDKYGIKVDYSRNVTVANVFTAATKAIIFHDHVWPFMFIGPDSIRPGMPSWVPSFKHSEPVFLRVRDWFAAGGPGQPQPEFFDNDTIMRISGVKLASFESGLYAQWPLEDTVVREEAVEDWVSAVLQHIRRRETMNPRVVLNFLEVFGYDDFYNDLREIPDDPARDMLALGGPLRSILVDEFDAATVALRDCRFFMLRDGTMGLVPSQTEIGDMIFVPLGGEGAIVVRETGTHGRSVVIGECYVHGIMAGELFQEPSEPIITKIDLV